MFYIFLGVLFSLMKKRAQAAMEYLLVGALVTLVILPTLYVFYGYSQSSNEEIKQSQINKFGTDIIDVAEQVYYLGESSKINIDETIPKGVIGIEIWENQEVVFFLQDGSEIAFKSKVNITTNQHCLGRCYGNFTERFYSPGLKHIIIEAKEDHVFIGEEGDDQTDQSEIEEKIVYCDEDYDNHYSTEEVYYCPSNRNDTEQGDDCDDSDYKVYPGATEICNNKDDDCDNIIDGITQPCYTGPEGTAGVGECLAGEQTCSADIWGPCIGEIIPVAEICNDSIDNNCNGLTDAADPDCFECTPEITEQCPKDKGVCSGSSQTCTAGGIWPGCDYGPDYEDPETSCDTLDNDCDGTVDEEDDMVTPNLIQDGVCSGSTQSCTAGSWQDNYVEILNYEVPEATCNDNLDNNCDNESDYDSQDGRHGDNNCEVAVTAIAVSDLNPIENTIIGVNCTSSVADVNSIKASIEGSTCLWKNWAGGIVKFDCNVGVAGTKTVLCSVDTTKSYQSGSDQTATITVRPSECSGYTTNSNCEADARCDWCPDCSGTEYSGGLSRCINTGACSYYCWKGECGALCDETQGPTTQDYYTQSGVESPTGIEQCDLREYSCTTDCGETSADTFQYSCDACKYISASSCTGTTLGSCTNYVAGTDIGLCKECNGAGGEQASSDDSACGTISCDDWHHQVGSDSATGTNYCYDSPDITINRCEGLSNCKDANTADCGAAADTLEVSCSVCKYISGCSGTTDGYCSNYPSGTSCETGMECDGNGNCVSACSENGESCSSDGTCCSGICGTDGDGDNYFSQAAGHTGTCQATSYPYTDCCDSDKRVYPGQTSYYYSTNNCGKWDYDCSGADDKREPDCRHYYSCSCSGYLTCYSNSGCGWDLEGSYYANCACDGYNLAACGELYTIYNAWQFGHEWCGSPCNFGIAYKFLGDHSRWCPCR